MSEFVNLPAPAKLNLMLQLVGQRLDGYHLIRSVFVPIDWADSLTFLRRLDRDVRLRVLEGPAPTGDPAQDLVVRAARALQRFTGSRWGVDIELHKRVPTGAGLGGGSSDAATTLIGLNRLWGLGLSRRELARIALSLGADVPFFIGSGPALVQGIGEHLTPLPPGHVWAQERWWAVLKPPAGVPTAAVFKHPELARPWRQAQTAGLRGQHSAQPLDAAILEGFAENAWPQWGAPGEERNDLQAVAQLIEPQISEGLHWLQAQGLSSGRMSGSGSAVFAPVLPEQRQALEQAVLPSSAWAFKVCRSLSQHPLAGWLAD